MGRSSLSHNEFLNRAHHAHSFKYNYTLSHFKTQRDNIIVICPKHGQFHVSVSNHIKNWNNPNSPNRATGCGWCGKEFTINRNIQGRLSQQQAITNFQTVHGTKYNYDKTIYKNWRSKLIITCPVHGDFVQRADNHKAGCGCPKCKNSKGENIISNWLNKNKFKYEREYSFNGALLNTDTLKSLKWISLYLLIML